jgi:hypothetical protein
MAKQSQKWKVLEKKVASTLTEGTGQDWTRKQRGANFAISDTDVETPRALSHWKLDAKKYQRFAQHTLMQEIVDKYCTEYGDEPILFTEETLANPRNKAGQKLPTYDTISLELFTRLTDAYLTQLEKK